MATLARTAAKCAQKCPGAAFSTETTSFGLKVVSVASDAPSATLGLVWKAGSRYETPETAGSALLLKHSAFSHSTANSDIVRARNLEAGGLSANVSMNRDNLVFSIHGAANELAHRGMPALHESLSPNTHSWMLEDTLKTSVAHELAEHAKDHQAVLLEALHEASFSGSMGRTMFSKANPAVFSTFLQQRSAAENLTLVGVGLTHEHLMDLSAMLESKIQGNPEFSAPITSVAADTSAPVAPEFLGGYSVKAASCKAAHIALAFQGAATGSPEAAAAAVFKELVARQLGAAGQSFSLNYADSGLFGVSGKANGTGADDLVAHMAQAIKAAQGADEAAVNSAKLAVQTQMAVASDHPSGAFSAVARGDASVQDVSADAVKSFASSVLASKPAVAVVGNAFIAPSHSSVSALF